MAKICWIVSLATVVPFTPVRAFGPASRATLTTERTAAFEGRTSFCATRSRVHVRARLRADVMVGFHLQTMWSTLRSQCCIQYMRVFRR